MSNVPAELSYTSEHEWVSALTAEGTVRVGITDHAQDALGDVVYVDLPSVGDSVAAEDSFGEIESTNLSLTSLLPSPVRLLLSTRVWRMTPHWSTPILTVRAGSLRFAPRTLTTWLTCWMQRHTRLSWLKL